MDDRINISLIDVSNIANSLRTYNQNLDEILSYVKQIMNEISETWNSDSSMTIVSNFNAFSKRFDEESAAISSYAAFLDRAVTSYDSLESTLNSNASSFN